MKVLRHMIEQPFVTATGLAALVHSTWSLGTLFSGQQPDAAVNWQFVGWLLPALLIAFALDVGQIVTSAEIRQQGLNIGRGLTFFVFAAATYYLQWLYIAHHMPLLDIAPGVSAVAQATARSLRDAAIWLIPALLPLATLLYTLSGGQRQERSAVPPIKPIVVTAAQPEPEMLKLQHSEPLALDGGHVVTCAACGWSRSYDAEASAQRGLAGHMRQCKALHLEPSVNGHEA